MTLTLADIVTACTDPDHPANQPAPAPGEPDVPRHARPWWLVVVNPRRQPPVPKLVHAYFTHEAAEAERAARQVAADQAARQRQAELAGHALTLVDADRQRALRADRLTPELEAQLAARQAAARAVTVPPYQFFVIPRPDPAAAPHMFPAE